MRRLTTPEDRPPAAAVRRGDRSALVHVGAVALLVLVVVARYWVPLTWPGPLNDELSYVRAVRAVLAGDSPYGGGGYLYPPVNAYLWAAVAERFGIQSWLLSLRLANYAGVALAAWLAVFWLPWRLRWRVGAAAAVLVLSPAVRFGLLFANLSLAISGPLLLGLLAWRRRPWTAGALLGVTLAVKPLAAGAVAALALHRPLRPGRAHLLAALAACLIAAVGILALPHATEMLTLAEFGREPLRRSVGPHRLAHLLGWPFGPLPISLLVLVAGLWAIRRRRLDTPQLGAAAIALTLAVTPIVWSHTLVVTLPLQALALERLVRRWRSAPPFDRARRIVEPVLVLLACASLHLAEGATSIDFLPAGVQIPAVLVPAVAPAALAAYRILASAETTG